MVGDKKNNESESESEEINRLREGLKAAHSLIDLNEVAVTELVQRVKALEEHLMSLDHGSDQGNHPNDGGWFQ